MSLSEVLPTDTVPKLTIKLVSFHSRDFTLSKCEKTDLILALVRWVTFNTLKLQSHS